MRTKTCKVCRQKFKPTRPLQVVCSPTCAIAHSQKQKNAQERIRIASERTIYLRDKERLRTRSEIASEAQKSFNAFIRERDAKLPCISCGRFHDGQYHAGHYRSVGAMPSLRFEELNVHKQCAPCNNHKSGNIVEYRINLIRKIGIENVEWLEGHHEPKKYSIEELKEIKTRYKLKLKELRDGRS